MDFKCDGELRQKITLRPHGEFIANCYARKGTLVSPRLLGILDASA